MIFQLKETRLWWPSLNQSIPFRYFSKREAGEGGINMDNSYRFHFDPEMAEFSDNLSGYRMPISTSKLVQISTQQVVKFSSFTICDDGRVQVNEYIDGGYKINFYSLSDLAFTGYTYDPREDTY